MLGLGSTLAALAGFFPPDLSPAYLVSLRDPIAQTVGMACAGMLLALAAGIPLAVYVSTRMPGYRIVAAGMAALRAIPDLTLAILAVVLLGLGPAAGIAALGLFYTAMVGKVFAELMSGAPRGPIDALRATGAGPVAIATYGLIPSMLPDLLSFGAYSLDCAVRASVIVGAVGGGGIGSEVVGAINALDYRHVTTLIIVLLAIIGLVDALGILARKDSRWAFVLLPIGALALWTERPQIVAVAHAGSTFLNMLPPQLSVRELAGLPALLGQTAAIALFGTALGGALGFLGALVAARNVVPAPLTLLTRRAFDAARAVPELVFGLVLVVTVGVGPLAGILALGLHSGGVLGKLYAESFENVARAPVDALEATGAPKGAVVAFGIVPLALGPMAVHTLFRLEWNVRAAAVIGMIGAGGIGQALFNAQQLFFYKTMTAYVLVTWAIVMAIDALGARLRPLAAGDVRDLMP